MPHRPRSSGLSGFTLSEVLIALGILAIGITSVASLFPPAILMQKESVRDILGQQNVRSSESLIQAKALNATQLFFFTDNLFGPTGTRISVDDLAVDNLSGAVLARGLNPDAPPAAERFIVNEPEFDLYALSEVDEYAPPIPSTVTYPIPNSTTPVNTVFPDMRAIANYGTRITPPADFPLGDTSKFTYALHQSMLGAWGEIDRSFPSYIADPGQRELYVVPLLRRGIAASEFASDWQVFSLVLERYPEDVAGIPEDSEPYDDVRTGPYPAIYPDFAAIGNADAQSAIVAANPFDNPNYFPKVFRIPANDASLQEGTTRNPDNLDENEIQLEVPNQVTFPDGSEGFLLLPGDLFLGDDGKIYRVAGFPRAGNFNLLRVNEETRQSTADFLSAERSLRAIWIGLRPTGEARNPLRDVRVLSSGVARTEE
ncbi:MAG: prepilin-type N-terminal cleavage/methylation domain-containing protein [Planctomycetota bacterium]